MAKMIETVYLENVVLKPKTDKVFIFCPDETGTKQDVVTVMVDSKGKLYIAIKRDGANKFSTLLDERK